tara:strand:+ start:359 stop:928 length:570 start_codon:yes stop_codon:yes gene_type:complete
MYKYTENWFNVSEISNELKNHLDITSKKKMLEIGCFEGLSTVFFADNFLSHKDSRLDAVDPFITVDDNDHMSYFENSPIEANFDYNISHCRNREKISVYKMTSDVFFVNNNETYDFIYIDGCHLCEFIKRDMENSFSRLNEGGIMWMDDYRGGKSNDSSIKDTMDLFLEQHSGFKVIHVGYQLAIKKQL